MIPRRLTALLLFLPAACAGPQGPYEARGTVEIPEIDIAPMAAARVVAVRVEEGASVRAGDTLALLTQTDLTSARAAAEARVASALADLRELEAGARPEEIKRAEGEVTSAKAAAELAAGELVRARQLAAKDVVSQQALDNAVSADLAARGRLQAAEEA
ncbi:MAG: biotin/lipoyl-binding protein, partial [Gemmatimonadales bacterium]|nr:biotin/lipoyl-binding protein [Gemmatimonadales bacterium]